MSSRIENEEKDKVSKFDADVINQYTSEANLS